MTLWVQGLVYMRRNGANLVLTVVWTKSLANAHSGPLYEYCIR